MDEPTYNTSFDDLEQRASGAPLDDEPSLSILEDEIVDKNINLSTYVEELKKQNERFEYDSTNPDTKYFNAGVQNNLPKVNTSNIDFPVVSEEYSPLGNKPKKYSTNDQNVELNVSQTRESRLRGKARLRESKSAENLNLSNDSIGESADVTTMIEDYPLVPCTSVLQNSELFKLKSIMNLDNSRASKKMYAKHFSYKQNNNKNRTTRKTIFEAYEEFPDYLGYYFRELYRSTIEELYDQGRIEDPSNLYENEQDLNTVLPGMTQKGIDDNKTHVTQSMQGLYYMNSVKPPNDYLQYRLPETNRSKLAIFDMDETLIHCIPDRKVRSDTGSSDMKQTDVLLKCELSPGRVEYLPVNIRPYIKEAIIHLKQWYQVIVFTASKKEYADPILNYIDPDGTLIETR
jgi:hypothetical protein